MRNPNPQKLFALQLTTKIHANKQLYYITRSLHQQDLQKQYKTYTQLSKIILGTANGIYGNHVESGDHQSPEMQNLRESSSSMEKS